MPVMPAVDEWSYAGDPATSDVDTVRFYLQDTDPGVRLLSDLEIQYLVDQWMPRYDSLIYVASVAADAISNKFAGVASVSADGVSVDVSGLDTKYATAAARLRQQHKDAQVGGEVDITNVMVGVWDDYSIKPLTFGVGMDDNPEAGRQDYGSNRGPNWSYEDSVGWY